MGLQILISGCCCCSNLPFFNAELGAMWVSQNLNPVLFHMRVRLLIWLRFPRTKGEKDGLRLFSSSLLYSSFSFGFLGLSAFFAGFPLRGGVTWTQPCNCQFNHRPLPRIYNKERQKELSFMSHFLLQKRSITVYKSELYRIMWQKAWLMPSFEEPRITLWEISSVSYFHHYLSGPLTIQILNIFFHLDKRSAAKRLKSDTTETKSGIGRWRRPNFHLRRNFKTCAVIQNVNLSIWSKNHF